MPTTSLLGFSTRATPGASSTRCASGCESSRCLHPEKTRLIEFGRFAAERRQRRGLGKPETFTFLGFTFICGKTRAGKFQIKRETRADRMRAKLKMIKEEMWRRMHQPIPAQGKWLYSVVNGYFNYPRYVSWPIHQWGES